MEHLAMELLIISKPSSFNADSDAIARNLVCNRVWLLIPILFISVTSSIALYKKKTKNYREKLFLIWTAFYFIYFFLHEGVLYFLGWLGSLIGLDLWSLSQYSYLPIIIALSVYIDIKLIRINKIRRKFVKMLFVTIITCLCVYATCTIDGSLRLYTALAGHPIAALSGSLYYQDTNEKVDAFGTDILAQFFPGIYGHEIYPQTWGYLSCKSLLFLKISRYYGYK